MNYLNVNVYIIILYLSLLDFKIICRQTLPKKIGDRFQTSKQAFIDMLKKVPAVCTRSNAWKSRGRSYMGVTRHRLESDSLLRKSACLTVRRIFVSHTYDALAKTLSAVHKEFQISRKVVVTINDSGSNFVKAFRVFSREAEMQCLGEFGEEFEDDEIVIMIFLLNLELLITKFLQDFVEINHILDE